MLMVHNDVLKQATLTSTERARVLLRRLKYDEYLLRRRLYRAKIA